MNISQPTQGPSQSNTDGVFDEQLVQGQTASPAAQLAWDKYLASLTGTYTQVTISGSLDPTGVTCSDPVAVNQLANALNTDAPVSVQCNGRTWNTGDCGGGESTEFNSRQLGDTRVCACGAGYVVRPKAGNSNWGGAGTATCGAASQSLRVEFSSQAPTEAPSKAVSQLLFVVLRIIVFVL